jgi:sulfate adenylyltransferase subunit 2
MKLGLERKLDKSEFILREVKARFENAAVLWSTGKDSTACVHMIKNLFGYVPFPVVHIDTGFKFPEIYEFRDSLAKKWNLNLVIAKADVKITPDNGHYECCMYRKTLALKQLLDKERYDALILSIRWDEHPIRGMERFFSPRTREWQWRLVREKTPEEQGQGDSPVASLQDTELAGWRIFATDFGKECSHVRVHPILHWTEQEIWKYVKENSIPYNPLYRSDYVAMKFPEHGSGKRFRSLGCMPCTEPIPSGASTIDEIVEELEKTKTAERAGRMQDKERIMRRLRALGYM